jgi:CHAT domain-containing protein
LDGEEHLLISPESQLNLIPFAALVDEDNRYLVQDYQITYLNSGRDLLKRVPSSNAPPVLVANPDYDDGENIDIATRRGSRDLANLRFGSLPGTAAEAEAIAPLFPKITILTESNATEQALKQISAPQILHIATHGFFLEDVELVASPNFRYNRSLWVTPDPNAIAVVNAENPLLRSGLALAGFNNRRSGSEDGVLTALEVAGLDLYGTQLVVLSACDTGVGEVNNGEGVYGLRRALSMAGAQS